MICNLKHHPPSFKVYNQYIIIIPIFLISLLFHSIINANQVKITINPLISSVISSTSYNIIIQRNLSSTGTTITPQTLGSPILVQIVFADTYNISSTYLQSSPNNIFSSSIINQTIFINQSETVKLSYQFNNIRNPIPSNTPFTIYANIKNSANILADYATTALSFTTLPLLNTVYGLTTGNVSTLSNLSLTIQPSYWNTNTMTIKLALHQYWNRNLLNFTSSQILPSTATCSPACVINRRSSFSQIIFSSLPQNSTMLLIIKDINSPPTLQPADTISITIEQSTYGSIVQSTQLAIASLKPNNLQSLLVTSNSNIRSPVTLSIQLVTRDIFGPNDTISILLNSPLNSSSHSIILSSSLVLTYTSQVPTQSSLKFSNFGLVTTNYNKLLATITIVGISLQMSSKPVQNNQIIIMRNSYQYNKGYFSFAAHSLTVNSIQLTLSNSFANSNSTCQFKINFNTSVGQGHIIHIKIPQDIQVYSCIAQCINCTCIIYQQPSPSSPYFSLLINNISNNMTSLTTLINLKNPISLGYQIQACSTDSQNYTMQCGSIIYPQMTQATLNGSSVSVLFSNSTVYGISNYTIIINMTDFNLQNGFLTLKLPQVLSIVDQNNIICTINGATFCNVKQTSPYIQIQVTVESQIKIYTFIINNIRNPTSTQPFKLNAQFSNTALVNYFSISSNFYSVSSPYILNNFNFTYSTCKNSQSINTLNFTFILPFSTTGLVQSSDNQIYTTFSNPLIVSIKNADSFQPVNFDIKILTLNGLYDMFKFSFTIQNCQATVLTFNGFSFNGIPQNAGTMRLSFNNPYKVNTLQIQFPSQYPENISIISSSSNQISLVSPRIFILTLNQSSNPIEVILYNFTNPLNSNFFRVSTYKNGFLVSQNNNTIKYTYVSQCTFPCKLCQSLNTSQCLKCYSSGLTTSYLLNQITNKCVSTCPNATFLALNTSSYSNGINMCMRCPSECLLCKNYTYCQSCVQNYYLFNNTCVTDCPSTYYPINIQQICQQCISPCQNCLSNTFCSTCVNGYYLLVNQSNSTCTLNCVQPYLALDGVCRKCLLPCLSCSVSLTNCTSCVAGLYLSNNQCLSVCPTLSIGYNGLCTLCYSNCKTCITNLQTCTSCNSPFFLSSNKCLSNCPLGFFGNQNVCIECNTKCTQCTSLTVCSKCNTGFIFLNFNNSCLQSCPLTYYNLSGQCKSCSSSCLQCTNSTYCTLCSGNLYIYANTCVSSCPTAMLPIGSKCQLCPNGCKSCISLTTCDSCLDTFGLYLGNCLSSCPNQTTNQNLICVECQNIYDFCKTCNSLGCTLCQQGFSVNSETKCVSQCLSNQISLNGFCKKCSTGCTECINATSICLSCQQNYFYMSSNNSCLISCQSPLIGYNGLCVQCQSPCLTCKITPSICLSCNNSTYLLQSNNTCLDNCPIGYYNGVNVNRCQSCQVGCGKCDELGCLQCLGNKLRDQGSNSRFNCYDSCPSHLPYIINNSICSQCSANCLSCNNQQCLICKNPYLRYGLFCVNICPAGYWQQSQSCTNQQSNNTNNNTNTTNTTNTTTNATVIQQILPKTVAPVPFSIAFVIVFIAVGISKLNYSPTVVTISILSIGCIICQICNLFYLGILWPQYALVVSIILAYIVNLFYLLLSKITMDKDERIQQYKQNNIIWWYITKVISVLTFHLFYVIIFSKLFNLNILKAKLDSVKCLKYLNILWGISLLSFILGIIDAIVGLSSSLIFQIGYIDILIVNLLMLLFAIVLLRKTKQIFQYSSEQATDTDSIKKVKLQQTSNANIGIQIDSMEQLNGHLVVKNPNQVANQNQLYPADTDQSIQNLKIDPHLNMLISPQDMNPPTLDRDHGQQETQQQADNLSKQNDITKVIKGDDTLKRENVDNIFDGMYENEQQYQKRTQKISKNSDSIEFSNEDKIQNHISPSLRKQKQVSLNSKKSKSNKNSKSKQSHSSQKNSQIIQQFEDILMKNSKKLSPNNSKSSSKKLNNDVLNERKVQTQQRNRKSKLSSRSHSGLKRVTQEDYHSDQQQLVPKMNRSQNISLTFNMKSPLKITNPNKSIIKNNVSLKQLNQSYNSNQFKDPDLNKSLVQSKKIKSKSFYSSDKQEIFSKKSNSPQNKSSHLLKDSPYLSKSIKSFSQNKSLSKSQKSEKYKQKSFKSSQKSLGKPEKNSNTFHQQSNKYQANNIEQEIPLKLNKINQDELKRKSRKERKNMKNTQKRHKNDNHRYTDQTPKIAPYTFHNNQRISGMHTLFIESQEQKNLEYDTINQIPPNLNTINEPFSRLKAQEEDLPVFTSNNNTKKNIKQFKKQISYIQKDEKKLDLKLLTKQIERKAKMKKEQEQLKNIYLGKKN